MPTDVWLWCGGVVLVLLLFVVLCRDEQGSGDDSGD